VKLKQKGERFRLFRFLVVSMKKVEIGWFIITLIVILTQKLLFPPGRASKSMSRSNEYASKKDIDSLEELSEKLKSDLRRHIRCIGNFPVLSDRWCDMADTLGRVAVVSEAEANLPREAEGATLWETEEAALRYVLEDGKLNLCLRNMVDFKQVRR